MKLQAAAETASELRELPSGRQLLIGESDGEETIEVRSPEGAVEVTIVLSPEGPVIRAAAKHLEIGAAEDVAVECRKFRVQAEEMDVDTSGAISLDGEFIYLNCEEVGDEAAGEQNA